MKLNDIMRADVQDVCLDLDEFGFEGTLYERNCAPVTFTFVPHPDDSALALEPHRIQRKEMVQIFVDTNTVNTDAGKLREYRFELFGLFWKWDVNQGVEDDTFDGATVRLCREKPEKVIGPGLVTF